MTGSSIRPRSIEEGDGPRLRTLQGYLAHPSPELLAFAITSGTVRVSTDERDRPVGYLLPVAGSTGVHVAELVVAPTFRREGRARALLEDLLAGTTGSITLHVAVDNDPAHSLYESVGFRVADRQDGYYGGTDALLYRYRVGECDGASVAEN